MRGRTSPLLAAWGNPPQSLGGVSKLLIFYLCTTVDSTHNLVGTGRLDVSIKKLSPPLRLHAEEHGARCAVNTATFRGCGLRKHHLKSTSDHRIIGRLK